MFIAIPIKGRIFTIYGSKLGTQSIDTDIPPIPRFPRAFPMAISPPRR